MANEHKGTRNVCAIEQDVEVPGHGDTILRDRSRIAPASPRAVVDAHFRVVCDRGRDPSPVGGSFAKTGLEDDSGTTGSDTIEVKPVPSDIDQLARCWIRAAVER